MPRQIRDTRRPVEPRLTYSMNTPLEAIRRQMLPLACGWYAAPGAASPSGGNAPGPPGMPRDFAVLRSAALEHVCHRCGNGDILVSPSPQRRQNGPRNEEVAWG